NRQQLTDKHPRVLAINDQISAINRQIDELRQQDAGLVSQSPEARELAALESDRNQLKVDLEVAGRELARRSAMPPAKVGSEPSPVRRGTDVSKLVGKYLDLKRSYAEVTKEIRNSEANREISGNQTEQLQVIQSANLPERPLPANRSLVIASSLAVGLAL